MNAPLVLFWVFSAVLMGAALRVITARNPVHAALYLVLCFFTAASIWLLLHAEFLALTLIIVYVGAVMVLFLFVVMMLDINFDRLREGFWRHLPLAGGVGAVMAIEMGLILGAPEFARIDTHAGPPAGYSNAKALGLVLYTEYVLPFELAAVILLVAMVAAIAITHRHRKETKYQDPRQQLAARKADRLRMVNVPSEPVDRPGGAAE
jgi:NADH-quinone oxidoreductase subunit J